MADPAAVLAHDLWATGLQSNDQQARDLIALGWVKDDRESDGTDG